MSDEPKTRAVGVDPGRKRIGLAISDARDDARLALPLTTVQRQKSDAAAVKQIVDALQPHLDGAEVSVFVVGLALRLDGTEGEAARRARAFGEALEETGAEVVFWDERLTTVSAERGLGELGVRGAAQRRVVDQAAAAILLQSWLDAQRTRDDEPPMPPSEEEEEAWGGRRRGRRGRRKR